MNCVYGRELIGPTVINNALYMIKLCLGYGGVIGRTCSNY